MAENVGKRIVNEDAPQSFPSNNPQLEVIERENNNTTAPNANQTNKTTIPVVKK